MHSQKQIACGIGLQYSEINRKQKISCFAVRVTFSFSNALQCIQNIDGSLLHVMKCFLKTNKFKLHIVKQLLTDQHNKAMYVTLKGHYISETTLI